MALSNAQIRKNDEIDSLRASVSAEYLAQYAASDAMTFAEFARPITVRSNSPEVPFM